MDEIRVNADDCNDKILKENAVKSLISTVAPNPTGKGKRLIVMYIGSEESFVDGGLLTFESKKGSLGYHDEMNGHVFFRLVKNHYSIIERKFSYSNG